MRMVTSVEGMQRLGQRWQRQGVRVGFVPTMGCLHAGHLSLVREARRRVGGRGVVVVSIYVNPTQFAPSEDLAKYPRTLAEDRRQCRAAGVDVLFVPSDAGMYPRREGAVFSTYVVEEAVSQGMEGAARPSHFRGVTTVVAKLFHLVLPAVAVFGAKDYQQAAVVRRMVRDLAFPVEVVVAPTVREPDGLALSSRNQYLDPEERRQATVLWRCLQWARGRVRAQPHGLPVAVLRAAIQRRVAQAPAARLDYVAWFDPETLAAAKVVKRGMQMALAVCVGRTRLIDNARME
jgi:pantoate--beta-alanine ligase